jgi:hypothetical protein
VTSVKYARLLKNNNTPKFKGLVAMSCFYCPTRMLRTLPIESFIKLIALSYLAYREIFNEINYESHDSAVSVCMISGFLLASIIEILIYFEVPLPHKTEYFFNLLSALIQLILVNAHKSPGLENTLHELWIILIGLTFIAGCCEVYDPNNVWTVYMRICFFLTQESWLMQIAFVLWSKMNTDAKLQQNLEDIKFKNEKLKADVKLAAFDLNSHCLNIKNKIDL